jgi:anti-sigma regulatory factor (Ser/Thr protein kinase)
VSDVALLLPAHPEHVRTARLVVVAAARRAGLDDDLVDELRLAVSEACARAIGLNRGDPSQRIEITVSDDATGLRVSVADRGAAQLADLDDGSSDGADGADEADGEDDADEDLLDPDLSLALITGLVERAEVATGPDGTGTVITLTWPLTPVLGI